MPQLIIDHLDGCTPTNPCGSCKVNEFLRKRLKPQDYSEFILLIASLSGADMDKAVDEVFDFTPRICNILKNNTIVRVRDLVSKQEIELLRLPSLGQKQLNEIKEELARKGYSLHRAK